ncbi:MAG TPA: hypothetical protein VFB67_09080 [Candidatus Polarisedimenticolaceae bacterium]|nr:hypothetical protein [Candidatus Polarisedimenticolaceae bacterium]
MAAGAPWIRRGLALSLIALGLAAPDASANSLGRDDEAVVLTGASVPAFLGWPVGSIVAFRYEGGWRPIPLQIDERKVVDFGTIYDAAPMGTSLLAYTDPLTFTGADVDPALDADDEMALRARDAGVRAPMTAQPAHTVAGSRTDVSITNPIDSSKAWVSLFKTDGSLDPAAGVAPIGYTFSLSSGSYMATYSLDFGPNPESSTVTTPAYSVHFSDRWIRDQLRVTAGSATGVDILDRHKDLFAPGQCGRTEDTFSAGEGAFIVNRTGPVRAIRGYVGANSGVTTYRVHRFYEAEEDVLTALRVHALPGIVDYFDYAPAAAGMTYRNDLNTGGVPVNGSPDAVAAGPITWEMMTGAQGTIVSTFLLATDIAPFATTSYYSDTTLPPETQCTGDAFEYGASGFRRADIIPNTDPTLGPAATMELTRVIRYAPPNQSLAFAQRKALEAQSPLAPAVVPPLACGPVDLCDNGADDDCDGTTDVSVCDGYDTGSDGRVDGLDLSFLGRSFGQCGPSPADFDGDGCVDGADLALLAAAWACAAGEDVCAR